MKNFEERLSRLEALGEKVKKTDVPLDEALAAFEEGVKLARGIEKDLEQVESRVDILMNSPEAGAADGVSSDGKTKSADAEEKPELSLFDGA
jgi:exodeoxyribonuclease VII small subunit